MAAYLPISQLNVILVQMQRSKCKYWWITDTDNVRTVIAENESNAGDIEDCFNELVDVLNPMVGDYVFVIIRNKLPNVDEATGKFSKGTNVKSGQKFEYRVKLTADPQAPTRPGGTINGFGGGNDFAYTLMKEIGDLKALNVEERLTAKIAALEKNGSSTNVDRLIEAIAGRSVDYIAGMNGLTPPVINGTQTTTTTQPAKEQKPLTEEEKKVKVEEVSANMKKVTGLLGADYYKLIEAMAKQAEANPEAFKAYTAQLIKNSGVQ